MKHLKKYLLFLFFIAFTNTYVIAEELENSRIDQLIKKSKNTRKLIEQDQNKQRDPASLKSNTGTTLSSTKKS